MKSKKDDMSLPIAYSIQRKSRKRKMSDGGMVDPNSNTGKAFKSIRDAFNGPEPEPSPTPVNKAFGGMAEDRDDMESSRSIADAILRRRRRSMEDSMADVQENGEELAPDLTPYSEMAAELGDYDDDQLSAQPEDSNLMGDDIESDAHDMVDEIRRKARLKRGM